MKRVFAFFFCAMLAGQAWAQTFTVGNLKYSVIEGTTNVSVIEATYLYNTEVDIDIPSEVTYPETDGVTYMVTTIGNEAFDNYVNLKKVTIPNSVTSIGERAFMYCPLLTTIVIPESVTSIGNYAFSACYGLTTVTFSNGSELTRIGDAAFLECGVITISIPNLVTTIGKQAFSGCSNLTSITIPNSVTGIGYNAFGDCQNVKTLTFDTDAVFITPEKWNAFNWGGLEYSFEDMMMMDKEELDFLLSILELEGVCTLLFSDMSSLETINIGENVSFIGPRLFHNNNSIKTVNIGSTVKLIGTEAFSGCTGLASISIPESVIGIGEDAFSGVNTLIYSGTAVGAPWGANHVYGAIDDYGFIYADKEMTHLVGYIGNSSNITIPNTVTSIGNGAFRNCSGLASVTIPNSVTSIGEGAFYNCPIETLTYNTNAIGSVFSRMSTLKTINIGDAVTEIADGAFSGCGLTLVTIPESVTRIGENAFSGCNNLTSVTIETDADVSNVGLYFKKDGIKYKVLSKDYVEIVGNNKSSGNSHEYGGKPDEYSGKPDEHEGKPDEYSGKPDEYEGKPDDDKPENDDSGNSSEDDDITNITELVIPATVTAGSTFTIVSIADNAFGNYNNLTSITIETDVDVSKAGLNFYKNGIYYSVLTKNTLSAFNHKCRDAVVIPATVDMFTVTTISFTKYSPTITSLTIPNTITKINRGALGAFDNLESVTIESNCDLSDAGLSFKKDGIYYEVLSKSTAKLVNGRNCSGDLVIPDTIDVGNDFAVTSIGVSAFLYCGNLTSITLPKSLERIGGSAFGFCENLNSITLPEKLTSIEDEAFANCINLSSITIPESVTNIGNRAFEMCSGIKSITYNSDYVGSLFRDLFFFAGHNIQTVNIGDAVTRIDDGAFGICPNLTSITIPEQITYVGANAFGGNSLTSVTIETDADVSNAGLSFTKDDIGYSVISRSTAKLTNGASFSGDLEIPEKVIAGNTFAIMGIGEQAFANNTNITSVTLPEWVTSIGDGAFSGCNNIETLTYNTDAVGALFSGIQSLKTVNIGDAVTRLEDGAFAGCKYLENVSVGNGIESVGNNVFDGCNFLDYNIYSNGYYLGNSQNPNMILMSARNKSITSCTVSVDCRFICDGAFRDCKKLAEVTLPESLTYVNNGLFSGCGSLRSVAIPESVKAIGNDAFKGCSSLAEIKIPESVTTIGSHAFAGCSGLSALTIPNGVTSVSNNAFDGCTSLETVVIGKSVAEFSSGIFANCSDLNRIICYAETPIRLEDDPFIFSDTIYVPAASVGAYKSATIWKRKDIMPFYKVKILSANGEFGTAEGDTLILGNHTATLTATAFDGYHFVRWSDNNTDNPRALAATKDTVLTAYFEAHTAVPDLAVAATCEAFGLTEGSHCPGCGYVFVKQDTLPATGHSEVVDVAVAPTCTVKGKTEGSHCSVCNAVLVAQNDIAALGHKEVADAAVAPTCTKTGLTAGKHCMVCEAVTVAQTEVPALGHKEVVDAAVAPTCTESGLTEGKHCSVCDVVIVAQKMVLALGHKEVIDAGKAATCTESGKTEGKHCSVCNAVLKEQAEIAALGHIEVVDAAVAATCTEPGLTEGKHCSVCRHVLKAQEVVPAMGHTVVVDSAVAPACTEPGLTEGSHCSVCNAVIVPQVKIPMLKHDIVLDTAVAATATTDGLTEGLHCAICGEVFRAQRVIPALGEQPGENENQGGNEQGNENQGGNENQEGNENQNTNPGTAVSEQIAELCIHAHHNIIVVENADAEIRVYDAMGRLVGRDAINRVRAEIRVNVAGIYIVRVGSVAKRVMIND